MKAYKSKIWMEKKFLREKLSEEKIAEICGVNQSTIHRWLKKHGLRN